MKQTIGKFLATLRKAKGLTQEEVADKLNISNKTLSSWETDRTTPDALTLPAIADLYEVTVDEILRGERIKNNEQSQISEKAKLSLTRKKYGKFSTKHLMFTAFGMLAVILNILGFAFLVYTAISEWVGILLSIIGFCGAVTLTILLIFFEYTTLLSEGIIDGDNLSENADEDAKRTGNSLALCVKRKNSISLKLFSLPYLAFSLATLIFLIAKGGVYTVSLGGVSVTVVRTSAYIGFIIAAAVIGLIYLIWGICCGLNAVKNYADETQLSLHRKNKKLFGILSMVYASVTALLLIPAIVFNYVPVDVLYSASIPDNEATEVHTTDFEKFREISQTLILSDETVEKFGLESNEFVLSLPKDWQDGREEWLTDLGHGFYGTMTDYPDANGHRRYQISYKHEKIWDEDTGETYEVYEPITKGTIIKVYHDKKHETYDYILYLPATISEKFFYLDENGELSDIFESTIFLVTYSCGDFVGKNFSTGEYGLFWAATYYAGPLAWFCFVITACVDLIVCTVIYFSKRKKPSYKIRA